MVGCSAYGCNSRSENKEPGITFHKFPVNDPIRFALWTKKLHKGNWIVNEHEKICSKHFEQNSFYQTAGRTLLVDNAVPTIFDEPPKYLQNKCLLKKPTKRSREDIEQPGVEPMAKCHIKSQGEKISIPEFESVIEKIAYKGNWTNRCAAPSCKSKSKRLFSFPKAKSKEAVRIEWFRVMGMEPTTKRLFLCEGHFDDICFTCSNRRKLSKFAVPSLNPQISVSKPLYGKEDTDSTFSDQDQLSKAPEYVPSVVNDDIENDSLTEEIIIVETPSPTKDFTENTNNSETEIMTNIEEISVEICRICMKETTDAKNIFKEYLSGGTEPIHLAIMVCLYPVRVSINDSLPECICATCLEALSSCVNLRKIARKNDRIQREHLTKERLEKEIDLMKKRTIGNIQEQSKKCFNIDGMDITSKNIRHASAFESDNSHKQNNNTELVNRSLHKRNIPKENISPGESTMQPKSQSSILYIETENEMQECETLLNQEENFKGSNPKNGIVIDHQTTYLNVSFCLVDGYLMEHKFSKGNVRYLKCPQAKCPAFGTAKVVAPGIFGNTVSFTKPHNHGKPTETEIKKQKIVSFVRKKLQNVKGSTLKSIYEEICKRDPGAAQLVSLKKMKKEICNL